MNDDVRNEGTVDQGQNQNNENQTPEVKKNWKIGPVSIDKPKWLIKAEQEHPTAVRKAKIGAGIVAGVATAAGIYAVVKSHNDAAKEVADGLNAIAVNDAPALTDSSPAETLSDLTEAVADVTDSVVDVQEVSGI